MLEPPRRGQSGGERENNRRENIQGREGCAGEEGTIIRGHTIINSSLLADILVFEHGSYPSLSFLPAALSPLRCLGAPLGKLDEDADTMDRTS